MEKGQAGDSDESRRLLSDKRASDNVNDLHSNRNELDRSVSSPLRFLNSRHTSRFLHARQQGLERRSVVVEEEEEFDEEQRKNQNKKIMPRFIIHPASFFRKRWMQLQLVISLYIIWITPVRVGFDLSAQGFWFWMEGVINLFFWADLVLNFFTAYEHPITSALITDRKKIAQRYLRGWFVIDLLASFPSDYIVKAVQGTWTCSFTSTCYYVTPSQSDVSGIAVLRFMRLFRVIWILKNYNILSLSTLLGNLQYRLLAWSWVINVAELVIILLCIGHVCGCFFYMFGGSRYWRTPAEQQLIEEGYLSTWVLTQFGGYAVTMIPTTFKPTAADLQNFNSLSDLQSIAYDNSTGLWYRCPAKYSIASCPTCQAPPFRCNSLFSYAFRYITSIYWATTTLTTVGYGDIYAFIIAEKVWTMATMVVGGFFLSFCFGKMATILSKLGAEGSAKAEQMEMVTQFLKDVELPKQLNRKVLDYFQSSIRNIKSYDRATMLSQLPFQLRSSIMAHLYLPTMKEVPLLQRFAEDELFLTDLCTKLQPYRCSADTFVFQKGESHDEVYILMRGEVHILDDDRKTVIYIIPVGTVFGEGVMLRRHEGDAKARRTENVLCCTECDMLKISADDLLQICDSFPRLLGDLKRLYRQRVAKQAAAAAALKHSPSLPSPHLFEGHSQPSCQLSMDGSFIIPPLAAAALQHPSLSTTEIQVMLDKQSREMDERMQRQEEMIKLVLQKLA
jgi:CRP-like cAMP-binding protein